MSKINKNQTLLVIAFFICSNVFAQPKPWSFEENVLISPNLYTGTMQLAVPFYTYRDADFEIPITFGYASSGCVANVRGGIMGPGWGLNAGGSITREIRGISDDLYKINLKAYGFYALHKHVSSLSFNSILSNIFRVIAFGYLSEDPDNEYLSPSLVYNPSENMCYALTQDSIYLCDAEPDIFHFNFMGYSGSFHLGFNGNIHIYNTNINSNDFKIEITDYTSNAICGFASFTVYANGYKYKFDCKMTSKSVTAIESVDINKTISFNLVQITAPNGRTANFEYERKRTVCYTPASFYFQGQHHSHLWGGCLGLGLSFGLGIRPANIHKLINDKEHLFYENVTYTPVLKKITVNASDNTPAAEINFNYISQSSVGTEQYRKVNDAGLYGINDESVKLQSITVNSRLNGSMVKVKECSLQYMSNTNGAKTSYLKSINIQGEGSYTMAYHHWNNSNYPYPANGTFSVDRWGYYNGSNNSNLSNIHFLNITSLDAALNETSTTNSRDSNFNYAKCGVLSQITCPAGGRYTFDYEQHKYSKVVKRTSANGFVPQLVSTSPANCGGLRILAIKAFSNSHNSTPVLTKQYSYQNSNTGSGILLNEPRNYVNYFVSFAGNPRPVEENIKLHSNDLTEFNNIHIEYASVRETLNDGSIIKYSFTNSSMPGYMDTLDYNYIPEKVFHSGTYRTFSAVNHTVLCNIVAPVSSRQFMRGKLLKTEAFTGYAATTPINTETNEYSNEYAAAKTFVPHYYVRALGNMAVYTGTFNIKSSVRTQNLNGININTETGCTYNAYGQVASRTSTDSRGITQTVEYRYVTDTITQPDGSRIIDIMAKQNLINLPLSEEVYAIENGVKTKTGGKRYKYFNPVSGKPAMVRLQEMETYDSETGSWIQAAKFTAYDNSGNLLEEEDGNGIKTCYIWGYRGLYKIAEIHNCSLTQVKAVNGLSGIQSTPRESHLTTAEENALRAIPGSEITTFEYLPLTGLTRIKDSTGKSLTYRYNRHGKLEKVLNTAGEPELHYSYSTDKN